MSAGQIGIVAQLGTAIPLVLVFWYLYRLDGERHLRIWAWSWAVSVVRLLGELALDSTPFSPASEAVVVGAAQVGMSVSAFLLLWGTLVFVDRRMPGWGVAVFSLTAVWVAAALAADLSFRLVSGPIWMFVGAVYVILGLVILQGYRFRGGGGMLVGVSFLVWGVHKVDYPLLRTVEWFSPIGFVLGSGLQVLVAVGMVLMHLHRMRAKLARSEERFRMMAEQAQDIIYRFRLGPEQGFEYVSPAITRITGYSPEECYADPHIIYRIAVPEERERIRAILSASRLRRMTGLMRGVTKEGDPIWLDQKVTVIRDEQGHRVAHEGIIRDVTTLKEKEEEQARLVAALEQAAEAVVVFAPDMMVLYVNSTFTTQTGMAKEDVLGSKLSSFFGELPSEDDMKAVDAGNTYKGLMESANSEGGLLMVDISLSAVRDEKGAVRNYVAVGRDVTHEKELELRLEQSQRLEALGRMAGGVAHDFNNILTVLRGNMDRLATCLQPEAESSEELQEMREYVRRGADLTGRLLAFSRGQVVEKTVVDLNRRVEDMRGMLTRIVGEGIHLRYELRESPTLVHCDKSQLEQVVMNLVANARDAVEGEGNIVICVDRREAEQADRASFPDAAQSLLAGAHALLSVRDDGVGIAKDELPHIFEPFYTRRSEGSGTGLGLATVYGIVKQSGGEVEVESERGQGSCFRVLFPLAEDAVPPEDREKDAARSYGRESGAEEGGAHEPGSLEGLGPVLVVEDEKPVRRVVVRALTDAGCRVLEAPSGGEALRLMESSTEEVVLVVTDVIMPGWGGVELARAMRERSKDVALVFLSGYARDQVIPESILGPRTTFLEKPFHAGELVAAVARVSRHSD